MKRVLLIFLFGTVVGIGMTVIKTVFSIGDLPFWLMVAAITLGISVFNLLYVRHYNNKIRQILPLLDENRNREYVEAMEDLLGQVRGRYLKNLVNMDLAVGYLQERRFDEAIELLEELYRQNLKGSWNTILRMNLCFTYFRAGRYQEGLELYEESCPTFDRVRGNSAYQGTLAMVDIFVAITEGRYQDAQTQLDQARATWNSPRSQANHYYLQTLLDEQYKD